MLVVGKGEEGRRGQEAWERARDTRRASAWTATDSHVGVASRDTMVLLRRTISVYDSVH